MPELPEVQTIVDDLQKELPGRRFLGVEVRWSRSIAAPGPHQFERLLIGRSVESLGRRGKYILLRLSGGHTLIVHLRMTGALLLGPCAEDSFARVIFTLDDGSYLTFRDIRKFGRLWLVSDESAVLGTLGQEPLSADLSAADFARMLRERRGALKPLLLDQRFLAGIGNIYVDESLFEAGLHPMRLATSLNADEAERLYHAVRAVLQRAIQNRGTSFRDYVDGFGRAGGNVPALRAYGRAGQPCLRCGTRIERTVVAQRGTFYCPRCQRPGA
ncbi:MAG: bifunctional DNA-formamidopyrimidine glycosylase/DNA-(apurinic or apyrimidinic site) lyase [Chloroflexota bacterium]|nr:MAG: bifunctional DNA-formamidopyrimidine glycosylase/DNA-(apurinic or apyrimidinic site) lyase [Chloroflexota bacterium]